MIISTKFDIPQPQQVSAFKRLDRVCLTQSAVCELTTGHVAYVHETCPFSISLMFLMRAISELSINRDKLPSVCRLFWILKSNVNC